MNDRDKRGYIGPGLELRGRLEGQGDAQIDGVFLGPIALDGALTIGQEGRLRGDLHARIARIEGRVEGEVHADEVHVGAGGTLLGDVRAGRVGLDDGGGIYGAIEMDVDLPDALFEAKRS